MEEREGWDGEDAARSELGGRGGLEERESEEDLG